MYIIVFDFKTNFSRFVKTHCIWKNHNASIIQCALVEGIVLPQLHETQCALGKYIVPLLAPLKGTFSVIFLVQEAYEKRNGEILVKEI